MDKIKRGKGRPQKLTDSFKEFITRCRGKNPDWSAVTIRQKLSDALYEKLKEKNSGLPYQELMDKVNSHLPGISAIQKYIKPVNKKLDSPSELEKPWHLGLMREPEYKIPPEVVPDILAVQEWCTREHPDVPLFVSEPLTIRQALWIARLYGITRFLRAGKVKGKNKNFDLGLWLWQCSKAYAQHEIISGLSGTPFDTSKLDKAIWSGAAPISADNTIDLFFPDNHIETIIEKEGEK